MYNYTYKTKHVNGKYYVGRHSTDNLDDGYLGSGTWVRQIQDKSLLSKEILSFFDSFEDLLEAEKVLISEHIDHKHNMNFNSSSVGFSTGDLNPSANPERRKQISEQMKGDKNPMYGGHSEEVKMKISKAMSGDKNPMYGGHSEETKQKMSASAKIRANTEEGKKQLSENGKKGKGREPWNKGSAGEFTIGEEGKRKISESWKNRQKVKCPHCDIECMPNTFKRWHGDKCKKLARAE